MARIDHYMFYCGLIDLVKFNVPMEVEEEASTLFAWKAGHMARFIDHILLSI